MKSNLILEVQQSDYINPATSAVYPEPVLLQGAKDYIRVSSSSEDTVITNMITSARTYLEQFTGLCFKPQNINVILQNQLGGIHLPFGPIVSSVTWNNPLAPAVSTDLNIRGNSFQTLDDPSSPVFNVSFNNSSTGITQGVISDILNLSYVGGYGFVGQLAVIQIISGGSGYTVAPTVNISAPTGANPITATATAFIKGGSVTAIVITNPGNGYLTAPVITFTGTNTTPAIAISSLGTALPEPLRQAVLAQVAFMYLHRGDELGFTLSPQAKALASSFKRYEWAI